MEPVCLKLCKPHTTYNHFTALRILSGTTRVSRYQKKHSPTHTYHSHQDPLSASAIYYDPWHPLCSIYVPDSRRACVRACVHACVHVSFDILCIWLKIPIHTPSGLIFAALRLCAIFLDDTLWNRHTFGQTDCHFPL